MRRQTNPYPCFLPLIFPAFGMSFLSTCAAREQADLLHHAGSKTGMDHSINGWSPRTYNG
jgi:hypothetical protein